jgi:hypothetical protein
MGAECSSALEFLPFTSTPAEGLQISPALTAELMPILLEIAGYRRTILHNNIDCFSIIDSL